MTLKALRLIGTTIFATGAGLALAQERPGPTVLTPHKVATNVYWVEGGASNTGFVIGTTGVVAIDAQRTEDGVRAEMAAIAKITPKLVDTVIVTHGDPDHVGGLPAFPAGTAIIAQENTRAVILASAADTSGPPPAVAMYQKLARGYLPTRLIGATEKTTVDGVRMELIYVAPGHSAGDLIIFLPVQKVVFAGDIVTNNTGQFPIIHVGGSSLGWIAAVRTILSLKADTIICGHGALETRAQLQARLHVVEVRRAAIQAMVLQGKSLAEVNQALPETVVNPMFPSFNQTTYTELTKGYPDEAKGPWVNLVHKP